MKNTARTQEVFPEDTEHRLASTLIHERVSEDDMVEVRV